MRWRDVELAYAGLILFFLCGFLLVISPGCAELARDYEVKIQRKDTAPEIQRFPAPRDHSRSLFQGPPKREKDRCREYDYNGNCLD